MQRAAARTLPSVPPSIWGRGTSPAGSGRPARTKVCEQKCERLDRYRTLNSTHMQMTRSTSPRAVLHCSHLACSPFGCLVLHVACQDDTAALAVQRFQHVVWESIQQCATRDAVPCQITFSQPAMVQDCVIQAAAAAGHSKWTGKQAMPPAQQCKQGCRQKEAIIDTPGIKKDKARTHAHTRTRTAEADLGRWPCP